MFPGINPSQMKSMMKQMGIKQEEINAKRVIIEKDSGRIIIENPSVIKINMQGNESFQITGEVSEAEEDFSEEDIALAIEKTGKSKKEVEESLKKTGDLAETIIELGD
ncbi:nascent polypeptide-associated complex protein [Candidatus Pacearchaeota archaeon]|nr:nascent polypeptide-associated complex protein [Candidatus Pacearchaeota archaeon]